MIYNTQQKRLPLPEYGRAVQNMVNHALTIEDRDERQRCANTIISIMSWMSPQQREMPDFRRKLWTTWPSWPTSSWTLTTRSR